MTDLRDSKSWTAEWRSHRHHCPACARAPMKGPAACRAGIRIKFMYNQARLREQTAAAADAAAAAAQLEGQETLW